MLGTRAVKIMAMEENISPPRNANAGIRRSVPAVNSTDGKKVSPISNITASTMVELMKLLVAPHNISPAMTSSMLTGVAMMASNVFWSRRCTRRTPRT